MLAAVAAVLATTGLPAFVALIGVSVVFAAIGAVNGTIEVSLLTALPSRIVGLLESDLLQALPLYVLMGVMLDRLPLAERIFRSTADAIRRTPAAPQISAMLLGALLAPMNGSVGASVSALSRIVLPRLLVRGAGPERSLALTCAAATLGVVVPPSLVLILLGDAMMRAHTEAANAAGRYERIINTQDLFHGALPPAGIYFILCLALAWWTGRHIPPDTPDTLRPAWGERLTALAAVAFVGALLTGVAIGRFYAVEAAATGACGLALFGLASRTLTRQVLSSALVEAMAVSGALFALFVGATTFTLIFRSFGTDRLLDETVKGIPGGSGMAVAAVLLMVGLAGLVLDAFEIIFVIIPIVMPPLLVRATDTVWVAVMTMLTLQLSFLIPPFGYAVMVGRARLKMPASLRALAVALLPFLTAEAAVLVATAAMPGLVHVLTQDTTLGATDGTMLSDDEARERMQQIQAPESEPEPETTDDP